MAAGRAKDCQGLAEPQVTEQHRRRLPVKLRPDRIAALDVRYPHLLVVYILAVKAGSVHRTLRTVDVRVGYERLVGRQPPSVDKRGVRLAADADDQYPSVEASSRTVCQTCGDPHAAC